MTEQADMDQISLRARLRGFALKWRNASYSVLDHLWLLGLWAASTPIFLSQLGATAFGIWTMVNALIGLGGVMSFGFGEATVRYVSKHHGEGDMKAIVKVVEASLTLYAATGLLFAVLIHWSAPWLVDELFELEPGLREQTVQALRISAYVIFITSYLKTLEAVINGFHRYDITAKIGMLTRSFIILSNVGFALAGYGIDMMLLMAAIGLTGQTAAYYVLVRRRFVHRFRLISMPGHQAASQIVGFGFQAWLQISAGAMGNVVDRFLVGAMISPAAAGVYAICLQLAQQIHLLVMRGGAYLMPATSALSSAGAPGADLVPELRALYRSGLFLTLFVVGATALPLIVLGPQVLTFWVGADVAGQGSNLLVFLVVYFSLYAGLVPPYYMLNGVGRPVWNTVATLLNGVIMLALAVILLPKIGLMAPVVARMIAFPTLGIIMVGLHLHVLPRAGNRINAVFWGWLTGFLLIGWVMARQVAGWPQMSTLALIGSVLALSGLGVCVAGAPAIVHRLRRRAVQAGDIPDSET